MKKFVELKTVEKGNVLINVDHIISIENIDDTMSKVLLTISISKDKMSYYTIQEDLGTIKRKLWEILV